MRAGSSLLRLLTVAPLFAFVALAVAACGSEPPRVFAAGERCGEGEVRCVGNSAALTCKAGQFRQVACNGARGCNVDARNVYCDESLAEVGTSCVTTALSTSPEGACSLDHKHALRCDGVQFIKNRDCKGPKGCFLEDHLVHCDDTLADAGDPCTQGAACSADHQTFLQCTNGALVATRSCHGPKGCVIDERGILCDSSIAAAGDPCERGIACAADNKTLLRCEDKKMVEAYPCRGPKGCGVTEGELKCDRTAAEAGDGCDQGATCSTDKSKLLECKGGKMVVGRECKREACKIDDKAGMVTCR